MKTRSHKKSPRKVAPATLPLATGSASDGLVWIFGGETVRAHKEGCSMLRTATKRNGRVTVRSASEKQSIIERGFRVVVCKCAKPNRAEISGSANY